MGVVFCLYVLHISNTDSKFGLKSAIINTINKTMIPFLENSLKTARNMSRIRLDNLSLLLGISYTIYLGHQQPGQNHILQQNHQKRQNIQNLNF
jgi:hypothetical protein